MFTEDFFINNFNLFDDLELDSSKVIEAKKTINKILKESRAAAKNETCLYCGKPVESFCNSHSLPKFCLKNIAVNGEVMTLNAITKLPVIDDSSGIKKAGTFHLICRECDNTIFSDYEDPKNYEQIPTHTMISQIALKNHLKFIGKRELEKQLYSIANKEIGAFEGVLNRKEYVNDLDVAEYYKGFNIAKKSLKKNSEDYYICYYKKLDYVVPLAFQSILALVFDLEGNIINHIYNMSEDYEIKNLHICVFPLENYSVVFMFIKDGDKRYRQFYKQLNKLPLEDQLSAITFMIFAYSEEMYFSKNILSEIENFPNLKNTGLANTEIQSFTPYYDPYEIIKKDFDFNNRKNIPNLLSEKYKIK